MHISTKILSDYKRKINEDNPSQRNCQNQLSNPGLSHIEQEFQGVSFKKIFTINKIRTKGLNTSKAKL